MKFLEPDVKLHPSATNVMISSMTRWERQSMHEIHAGLDENPQVCMVCPVLPQVRKSMRIYNKRLAELAKPKPAKEVKVADSDRDGSV
jgi:hypothetical protein